MHLEDWNQVHTMVAESVTGLLASVGLPNKYIGTLPIADAAWAPSLSIIGLGGGLRGSLVLSVPTTLLKKSHPAQGTDENDLADWLGELTNLVLGAIKLQLLGRGIATELSTPVTLSATTFRFARFLGAPAVHGFAVEGQVIYVIFEAVAAEGVTLAAPSTHPGPGDVISF